MGERALENRIKKLRELEAQQKELADQAEKIKAEIKADMQAKGQSEIHTASFIVRLKEVVTNRFDSKLFAKENKALYEAYTKPQSALRFTVI